MAPYLPFDCPTRIKDRNGCSASYVMPMFGLIKETAGWIVRCLRAQFRPIAPDSADNERRWEPPPYHF